MTTAEFLTPVDVAAVERILSEREGPAVRLETAERIRADDNRVLRVGSGDDTWVVKRADGDERLYEWWGFFAEWTAAATVTAMGADICPEFIGGDRDRTLMVFEDLGRSLDVSQLLRGHDADAAAEALVAMGGALGRMHAAGSASSVEADYRRRWHELCGDRSTPKMSLPATTLSGSLNQALAAVDVDFAFEAGALIELQAWALETADGWTLIHGDPCLDNWILDHRGDPKLIDFQGATFAPAALDAAYARAPFPTCWCLRRVPDAVVAGFEEAHRAALAAAGHELGERAMHRRQLTFATAWWFAIQIIRRLSMAANEDGSPRDYLGFRLVPDRDAILLRLESFLELSAETGALGELAGQADSLRAALRRRWGAPTVDLYPAFGGLPD